MNVTWIVRMVLFYFQLPIWMTLLGIFYGMGITPSLMLVVRGTLIWVSNLIEFP
jgi:hypothetical protein